jgi:hypothetical protein
MPIRGCSMNRLKLLALTALTAATVGVGALAAAPSASAMPLDCDEYALRSAMYGSLALTAAAAHDYALMDYYEFWAEVFFGLEQKCYGG